MGYYFCRTSFPSFKKCWRRTWPPDFFRTVKHERGEPSRRFVLTYTQQDPWYFIFLLFFVYKPSILRSPPSVQFHTTLYSSRWHYVARRRRQQKCTIFNRWARFFFSFLLVQRWGGEIIYAAQAYMESTIWQAEPIDFMTVTWTTKLKRRPAEILKSKFT